MSKRSDPDRYKAAHTTPPVRFDPSIPARGAHSLVVPEGSVPFAPTDFCGGIRRTGGALVDREAADLTCGQRDG